jgi:hypothetical protein
LIIVAFGPISGDFRTCLHRTLWFPIRNLETRNAHWPGASSTA